LGEAQVMDESGKILAHGTSTLITLTTAGFQGDASIPPKFLD
jgi:hypothetical protein